MKHPKYEETERAITDLIGDTSVSPETTRDALEELASLIEGQLAALNEEIDD